MIPLSFFSPLILLAAAALIAMRPGRRPGRLPLLAEAAAAVAFLCAIGGMVQLLAGGRLAGALQLDTVGVTMALLVSAIGWVVMRYARTYLDGEAREGAFHALMLATLAAVLVLVQAGSLIIVIPAFVATGLGLRQLLLFYKDRAQARRAATKFSLVWHAGDAALVLAALLLWTSFGTLNLTGLAIVAKSGLPIAGHIAAVLIVLAALLKTAAFPFHGWLTEVMEAPTPVSALLHAGIINAGGLLLIRNADLLTASSGAMAALAILGGATALFGSVVMLTQSAVKTALAWSTVAQMGFMLLQCGLGLWPLALLHIVAHGLYKAHAFLDAGGAVAAVASLRKPGPVAVPDLAAVAKAFGLALVVYSAVATVFYLIAGPKSAQAVALGAILIFGVAYLVAQGLADAAPVDLTRQTMIAAFGATVGYFSFQWIAQHLWGPGLPAAPVAGPLEWALIVLAPLSFGTVAVAQSLFPLWAHHPATAALRVHLANGLYLNALLDRMIGGFRADKPL